MSRRRRGALLLGLALALGGLAAADIGRREAAVRAQLAPLVDTVVARTDLRPGHRLRAADLGVRRIPLRYAPAGSGVPAEELVGRRLAAGVPRGGYLAASLVAEEALAGPQPIRRGERAAEVTGAASPGLVTAGAHVDVLAVPERGDAQLALEDVEVLDARPAPAAGDGGSAHVTASLRVTAGQAVALASLEGRAGELRLLPRARGDHRRVGTR